MNFKFSVCSYEILVILLYKSFVLSHFEYCNSLLMGIGKTLNKKLEDANYYGLRTIMNMGKSTDYESILRMADMRRASAFPDQLI